MITHASTSNISFLEMSVKLKKEGINNNLFMLRLLDHDLENIDPLSKYNTPEIKEKIKKECQLNTWYYLRECAIDEKGNRFILTESNLAMIFCFLQEIDQITYGPDMSFNMNSLTSLFSAIHSFNVYKEFSTTSLMGATNVMSDIMYHKFIVSTQYNESEMDLLNFMFVALGGRPNNRHAEVITLRKTNRVVRRQPNSFLTEKKDIPERLFYYFDSFEYMEDIDKILRHIENIKTRNRTFMLVSDYRKDRDDIWFIDNFTKDIVKWQNSFYDEVGLKDRIQLESPYGFLLLDFK